MDAQHTIREELKGICTFLAVIWAVFLLNHVVPRFDLNTLGLRPRSLGGLVGIASMPFLHANWGHIVHNTVPLFILLALLAGSQARSGQVVLGIILGNGAMLWLVGRPAVHIGASGLIFGLIAFLIISGWREKRPIPLLISLLVCFLYGWTLLWGVLPTMGSHVSWDGHLCGAISGGMMACLLPRAGVPTSASAQ